MSNTIRGGLRLAAVACLLSAVFGVGVSPAAAAPKRAAVVCNDHWTNAGGGSFTDAGNWDNGVPGPGTDACIDLAGTYTVTLTTPKIVNSLTIGGTGVKATLSVGSTCSEHVTLTTAAGLTNKGADTVLLTNADGCGNNAALSGPVTNVGTLSAEPANGGARTIQGNLTNTGTVNANQTTSFNSGSTTFANQGALNVANGKALVVSSGATFTNGSGGSISTTGTGLVDVEFSTFNQGAGTTSGSAPVLVHNGTLNYTGNGASSIFSHGDASGVGTSLSGDIAAGQSLTIESTCGEHAKVTASASFANAGTITLTNGDACGNSATLAVTSGTLTSSGAITAQPANGGQRTIQGNLTNTGTMNVNQSVSYNASGATLTNQGALNVADTKALVVSNGAVFTNGSGGSIATVGNGLVDVEFSTFNQGAGTTSGSRPVIVHDGTLNYTGSGASSIFSRGDASGVGTSLSGNLASGQSLTIETTCSEHAKVTAAASFANAGTITLTNADGCGLNATLAVTSGTLTSSGTVNAEVVSGGDRFIQGNLTNTGTINVNQTVKYNVAATLTNQGAVNVANTKALVVSGGATFTNGSGGSIATTGTGIVDVEFSTFNQGAGTASGSAPVLVHDGTLNYTGNGASSIFSHGDASGVGTSLSGDIAAGQSLTIESTCGEHAKVTASASFGNAGLITLTNGDGCGNQATLAITSGTLTTSGTINAELVNGGDRFIQGNLTNTGTINVNQTVKYNAAGATLTNQGAINVADTKALIVSNANPTFTNGAGGSIVAAGNGNVDVEFGTFNQGAGTTSGTRPVIVHDGTINYTGSGASSIFSRGDASGVGTSLSGNLASGQSLTIESTCGEHAKVTAAASFNSAGTITLTNADGCGNSATLALGTSTLTNSGTLKAARASTGQRRIEGNVKNTGSLVTEAINLTITGTYTQSGAGSSWTETITNASTFGTLSVGGKATLGGTLAIDRDSGFVPTSGSFAMLGALQRKGTFASVTGAIITGATYLAPKYSGTAVTLVVQTAKLSVPATGTRGSTVAITGSKWVGNETITLTLKDSANNTFDLGTAKATGSGKFTANPTIPLAAATGKATITAVGSIAGVTVTRKITII